jgi:hypothetical protein
MNNEEFYKAVDHCANGINGCVGCELASFGGPLICAEKFANYIKANRPEEKEPSKISDSPDFSEINGLLVLEHFKSIVKAHGGKVTALSAGNNEARIEYELDDCGYYMSFGGN